jgi:hypothetical protein
MLGVLDFSVVFRGLGRIVAKMLGNAWEGFRVAWDGWDI